MLFEGVPVYFSTAGDLKYEAAVTPVARSCAVNYEPTV